ncbi:MAG: hypothetical protein LLF76_15395 [Planctomycetaceae bacterium]|nr:hypothetical protein [Planctomycetaceae bacterium]
MKSDILTLVLGLSAVVWAVNGNMGNGDGSGGNPYLIEDLADFDKFADPTYAATYWAAGVHTKLMADIDLSGRIYTTAVIAPDTTEDAVFQGVRFSGNFYGNYRCISNLNISTATGYYIGLFGFTDHSYINRVKLNNFSVTGYDYVGGLCGKNSYGSIQFCNTTGTVDGKSYVGGLCGQNSFGSGLFKNDAAGTVTGYSLVGGLCGHNFATIDCCLASGTVIGNSNVGGFCGTNAGPVSESCATGTVSGRGTTPNFVGGFCGQNNDTINFCYSTGAVINGGIHLNAAGGFCGANASDIYQCYSTGAVAGDDFIGGLCGASVSGSITNSFWDIQTSGLTISSGGTGKMTAQMQTVSTFTEAGWNFFHNYPHWKMLREGEDYPRLAWQVVFEGDVAGLYGVDMMDAAYLARYWGLDDCGSVDDCGRADIDGDGLVGLRDLVILAGRWLDR